MRKRLVLTSRGLGKAVQRVGVSSAHDTVSGGAGGRKETGCRDMNQMKYNERHHLEQCYIDYKNIPECVGQSVHKAGANGKWKSFREERWLTLPVDVRCV